MRFVPMTILILLAGCHGEPTPPAVSIPQPVEDETVPAEVQIISDPPGARIIVNGDYVGDAPCTITVQRLVKSGYIDWNCYISALPNHPGGYVQKWCITSDIPKRVFFDTRLGPVTPSLDVNVR